MRLRLGVTCHSEKLKLGESKILQALCTVSWHLGLYASSPLYCTGKVVFSPCRHREFRSRRLAALHHDRARRTSSLRVGASLRAPAVEEQAYALFGRATASENQLHYAGCLPLDSAY